MADNKKNNRWSGGKLPRGAIRVHGSQKKSIVLTRRTKSDMLKDFPGSSKLSWRVKRNPKKKGSISHARFQKYARARTVADFFRLGGFAKDLRSDTCHNYVSIVQKSNQKRRAPGSSSNMTSESERVIKVACLGDSNTTGSGLGRDSYPKLLQATCLTDATRQKWKLCSLPPVVVRGFGRSGATAGPGNIQYHKQKQFSAALKWQAQIYVIMLGTNDAHQAKGNPDTVESALQALVEKIKIKAASSQIILVLPPGANSERCIKRMNTIVHPGIRRLGKRLKLTVVDALFNSGQWDRHLRHDNIHLTKSGANRLAQKVSGAIYQMFDLTRPDSCSS